MDKKILPGTFCLEPCRPNLLQATLEITKHVWFQHMLSAFPVDTDCPVRIGVGTKQRFRCTGVGRKLFGDLNKVYDFNAHL